MADAGLILTCTGCCCGQRDRGGALSPPRILKSSALRAYKASGIHGRVRLAFTDCLGPCSEANVIFVYLNGRPWWFRRMNSIELLSSLFEYVRGAIDDGERPLPEPLRAASFSWTGGGVGPEPPIEDAAIAAPFEVFD